MLKQYKPKTLRPFRWQCFSPSFFSSSAVHPGSLPLCPIPHPSCLDTPLLSCFLHWSLWLRLALNLGPTFHYGATCQGLPSTFCSLRPPVLGGMRGHHTLPVIHRAMISSMHLLPVGSKVLAVSKLCLCRSKIFIWCYLAVTLYSEQNA